MLFSVAAALFAASATLVSAQNDTAPPAGATHNVVVGGQAGLVFTPSTITAAVGDIITFEFQAKNHTVTQSAFASPCTLLQNATTNQVGFDSGYVPVGANATEFPAWSIQVTNADTPIWFYCKQGNHCAEGMVGAINAPTSGPKTFEAFKQLAMSNSTTGGAPAAGTTVTGGAGVGASASGAVSNPQASGAAGASSTGDDSAAGSVKVASTSLAMSLVAAVAFLFA